MKFSFAPIVPLTIPSYSLPHMISLFASETRSTGHKCQNCNLCFDSAVSLKTHHDLTLKPFTCSACGDRFSTVIGMKKHYGKLHAKYRPSRCALCKKRFRNKYAAKRHLLQVHQELSRISCEKCGKVLYNRFSLSRHVKVCER
jgi:DNA-directed RNA polymerase subunit RPC12/RpoP